MEQMKTEELSKTIAHNKELDKAFNEALEGMQIAILQRDCTKLKDLERKKKDNPLLAEACRNIPFGVIAEAIKGMKDGNEVIPELFIRYPAMKNLIFPKLQADGIITEVTKYRFKWNKPAAIYGEFIKIMASIFVEDGRSDGYLIKEQAGHKLFYQYSPYRDVFINLDKKFEAAARGGLMRRGENGYTKDSGTFRGYTALIQNGPK